MVGRFEWHDEKDRSNQQKHGVGFAEAMSVFSDDNSLLMADPDHSDAEDRFVLLGMSATTRILVVCHCYREPEGAIRIISARRATRTERIKYEERLP